MYNLCTYVCLNVNFNQIKFFICYGNNFLQVGATSTFDVITLGMGDSKNFTSQYVMREIVTIINIITISALANSDSTTSTKIVNTR